MCLCKRSLVTAVLTLATVVCYSRGYRYSFDSIDTKSSERVRGIVEKIGDVDYRRLGHVIIKQTGRKYNISFPFLKYASPPYKGKLSDQQVPANTKIMIKLENGKVITAHTAQDAKVYRYYYANSYVDNLNDSRIYRLPNGTQINPAADKIDHVYTYNGRCWLLEFEFSREDMTAMSKKRIVAACANIGGENICLPIKNKQSVKIKQSISAIMPKR
jgi:hypothetical protein